MKQVIVDKIETAIKALQANRTWPEFDLPQFDVSVPAHRQHGDFATNVAMKLAKLIKRSPLEIGELLKEQIDREGIEQIEIVSPGFVNLFINDEFYNGGIRLVLKQGELYGHGHKKNKTIMVEFLSANPTGPLHLGNGRGGFTGDVLAQVLRAAGYHVIAEYYMNDYGHQLDVLAESVLRRYLQNQGINIDYPDELYKGDYINELAKRVSLPDTKDIGANAMVALRDQIKDWAINEMITTIKTFVTETLKIQYDVWKSEKSLHTPENIKRAEDFLHTHNLVYDQDGATYFASSRYGDDKDRVISKSNGEKTYLYSDILYLIDKFEDRHIDHWVWFLGADHHGYQGRMEAALTAIGHGGQMNIIFVQLVRLIFNGKELRMSKRKGTFVTLEELVEEIGLDVARWFFLMYDPNTHMDFDLNLAREHSEQNPVYYVQYAYARVCSLLKKVGKQPEVPLIVTNAAEEDLAKQLFQFPDVIADISTSYHVHKLPQYTLELARTFHKFYAASRVIELDESINLSRLQLVKATQIVLKNSLTLMGISAPEKM